jgi:DNA helicase-2/ATP-dependent DNA helicase PcrA
VIKLEQNYRSTQMILDAANAVISHNRGQMAKHLWDGRGGGRPVRVREMSDEHAEARFVSAEIQRLVDEGVSRSEIAIFYRTNAQSRVLEDMLVRAQIAYQVIGGTKFYERAEIRDAIGYLTFLVNPQDQGAFTRIANSPRAGLGQTSLSRVIGYADAEGIPVWEAAERERARARHGGQKALARFMSTMQRLKERVEAQAPVGDLVEELPERDRLHRRAEGRAHDRGAGRLENLEELVHVAREYDATNPRARSTSSCSRSRCSPTRTRSATTRASSR